MRIFVAVEDPPAAPPPALVAGTAAVLDDARALAVEADEADVALGVVDVGVDVVLLVVVALVDELLEVTALGTLVWLSAAFGVSLPHAASAVTAARMAAVRTILVFIVLFFIVFPPW